MHFIESALGGSVRRFAFGKDRRRLSLFTVAAIAATAYKPVCKHGGTFAPARAPID
ncbi:hypothetical protein Pla52o_03860 [Novipirellula galeiformis]|uniref:Uncharacterized protein n=1 Tax=Novipirellula galeiformis TaxID=2528004 RepID=A0A5C6CNJ0_9BACT|nr:hypothetical protein Pla52o_03860 [Novipirellula galeiformis]